MLFDETLKVFPITVDLQHGHASEIVWQWEKHRFSSPVSLKKLASLNSQAAEISKQIRQGKMVHENLQQLGRAIGQTLMSAESADAMLQLLATRPGAFSLILINADCRDLVDLPWEALVLPGTGLPLLFHPDIRGNLDYARLHIRGMESGGRRPALKGLMISANSTARPLNVERQIEELSKRFLHHPQIRPRSFVDPQIVDIQLALARECALFLFAGHGKFAGGKYYIEINNRSTDIREFIESLKLSRAETLIFDSCESSYGGSIEGLPSLLKILPSTTCLLSIQGPGIDSVSCWHMPIVVERLMIGQPIWISVNAMRLLLYDQNADSWFLPVMHLKPIYMPLMPPEIQARSTYLDWLSRTVEKRRPS